jgi:hypothetical protein
MAKVTAPRGAAAKTVALALACTWAACSTSHRTGDAGSRPGKVSTPAITADAMPPSSQPQDAGTAQPCNVHYPSVFEPWDQCPADEPIERNFCSAPENAACIYFRDGEYRGIVDVVTCSPSRAWSVMLSFCGSDCPDPPATDTVVEIGSDCAKSVEQPCAEGFTDQDQLQVTLRQLLEMIDFDQSELFEEYLYVQFEHGCARRFFAPPQVSPANADVLRAGLANRRFSCARELSCATLNGGSID